MFSSRTRRIILSVVIAMLALAGVLWWLSWMPPRWYHPPDAHDPVADELAAQVELRLAEEMHKIREDDGAWRLRIREEHINVWLATRLPKWLEHERDIHWPGQFGTPQLRFDRDRISIAAPIAFDRSPGESGGRRRMMTLTLVPHVHEDEIRFVLVGVRVGRLGVPGDPLEHVERIADRSRTGATDADDDLAAFLVRLVKGETGLAPTTTLVDDRRVMIEELRVIRGALEVSAVTRPAQPTQDD